MEIVDKTEENACDTVLEEVSDVLLKKLGLSAAEVSRIENGEDIRVWIEAMDISATVSQTDKDLIDSKKGNATIGMYLDIDLLKKIGSDSPVNITDTAGAVTITMELPISLINTNPIFARIFKVVRIHDGVATVIPATFANGKITFATDAFSTYAIIYTDTQNTGGNTGSGNTDSGNTGGGSTDSGNTDGGNTGGGSTGDGSNDNVKDVVPKTGDASNAYIWFILALVSGIGALYFGKKGLVLKKEN